MSRSASAKRQYISRSIEAEILIKSRRRCCICFGLNGDFRIKPGQIAHLDGNRANSRINNLAYLCLEHHDAYDSQQSQSKGLTITEVKRYREQLYREASERLAAFEQDELRQRDLRTLQMLFGGLYTPAMDLFFLYGRDGAFSFDVFDYFDLFSARVSSSNFHIYDKKLKKLVDTFYATWNSSLNYSNHFHSYDDNKVRFKPLPEASNRKTLAAWQRAFSRFRHDLYNAERAYRNLLKHVRDNYTELDIDETNSAALAWHRSSFKEN